MGGKGTDGYVIQDAFMTVSKTGTLKFRGACTIGTRTVLGDVATQTIDE